MIGLVIATHGNASIELKKSVEMFCGTLEQCRTWTLNPGDDIEDGEAKLKEYVKEVDTGEGVVIMTDLFGGTPCNLALKLSMDHNIHVLTGVNLPMLIQFVSNREDAEGELIEECIDAGREGIAYPNKEMRRRKTNE